MIRNSHKISNTSKKKERMRHLPEFLPEQLFFVSGGNTLIIHLV